MWFEIPLGSLFQMMFLDITGEDSDHFPLGPRNQLCLLAFPTCKVALALTFEKSCVVLEKISKSNTSRNADPEVCQVPTREASQMETGCLVS